MQKSMRNQRGMSITSWIVVISVALFFLMLGLKLIPSYLRFYSISSIMDEMVEEGTYKKSTAINIRKTFLRRLNINGVYGFKEENLLIARKKGVGMQMQVKYEDRLPMVANIEVLVSFDKQVTL